MLRTILEAILLALILCVLVAPWKSRAEHGSIFDNRDAIEQQKQDQERYQQEQFRYEQRSKDFYRSPC